MSLRLGAIPSVARSFPAGTFIGPGAADAGIGMTAARIVIAGLVLQALMALGRPARDVQEEEGRNLFVRRCSGCHATDIDKEGPVCAEFMGVK
jgi:mono/diheme cytochrome c family protein